MRLFVLLSLLFVLFSAQNDLARKANQAYENGNYTEAIELYNQAIAEEPDNARLYFNKANALYKAGNVEEAMQTYERYEGLAENPEQKAWADYNQGTMLTDQEKFEEAADHFREALKKNPDDPDARHNYELALQRKQQEEQQQQQNSDQNQDSEQEQDQNQNRQEQDNDEREDQNQQQQDSQSPNRPDDQERESRQQPMPTEMTPEEAKNILDALAQLERKLLENMKKESTQNQSENEKDW